MPRLHVIGVFHTEASDRSSHCAFTGKALRFPKMMQGAGWEVVEYSNASESAAAVKVNILDREELSRLTSRKGASEFYAKDAVMGSRVWKEFNERLEREFKERFNPAEDVVCHTFGKSHEGLSRFGGYHVETGIGYNETWARFRIFESHAWMHYHQGKAGRQGDRYEWVVPNYFDLEDWTPCAEPGKYLLFFGRICSDKGMNTVREIAEHAKVPVVVCGQGDGSPWKHKNIHFQAPISGKARDEMLGKALAVLMPTEFVEPFGGSGVEGLLCGTPLIASDFGAFAETVEPGVNGFRCHTLGDWLGAVERVKHLDRDRIAIAARVKYSLEAVGKKYDGVFRQILDLRAEGWYNKTPRNLPCLS